MQKRSVSQFGFLIAVGLLVMFMVLVGALSWQGFNTEYSSLEGSVYLHDLVQNITGNTTGLVFDIDFNNNKTIRWYGSSGLTNSTNESFFYWIQLASSGLLTINATRDNQTGKFIIPIQASDNSDPGKTEYFNFTINATNDEPSFSQVQNNYSFPTNSSFDSPIYQIVLNDEEQHYPFSFNLTFYNNCTHAEWLNLTDGENCSVMNVVNASNMAGNLSYTYDAGDVGVYWGLLNVTEATHSCPHAYCDNATYETLHSVFRNITIQILANVEVNATNCTDATFTEGVAQNCTVTVRTVNEMDTFTLESDADFTFYSSGTPSNAQWFYAQTQNVSTGFFKEFNITVNANRSFVGNWTINLTATDLNYTAALNSSVFNISIDWTGNTNTTVSAFDSIYNSSIDKNYTVSFTASDSDFYIEDKNFYNESLNVSVLVINETNGDGGVVQDFYSLTTGSRSGITVPYNLTFVLNASHVGNYTVYVNITDNSSFLNESSFNLTVISNSNPYWNQTSYSFNFTVNSTVATTISNLTNINLSRNVPYANDSNVADNLTFTLGGEYPANLTLTSQGVLNFFPWKNSVGFWNFSVTATDDLGLSNTTYFMFNVSNVNSVPFISNNDSNTGFQVTNATEISNFNFSTNESVPVLFELHLVYDDDYLIYDNQTQSYGAYNEGLSITANVTNTSIVTESFNLSFFQGNIFPLGYTQFNSSFTPNNNNTGSYIITFNVTDASNASDILRFNLTILDVNQNPSVTTPAPQYVSIENVSFNYSISATDEEDGSDLNYSITNLTIDAPDFSINVTSGLISFNFNNNESYAGFHRYNVTVNDTGGGLSWVMFNVSVFGTPNITVPLTGYSVTGQENGNYTFNVTIDYAVNNTNLTYLVYLDNVTGYTNATNYNYSNLSVVLNDTFVWNSSTNLTFTLNYSYYDETYGLLKNLSLYVLNANYSTLNDTERYSLNISHINHPLTSIDNLTSVSGFVGTPITINLTSYFQDIDANDSYYNQEVNFSIVQVNSSAVTASESNWVMSLGASAAGTYNVSILAKEINATTNTTIRNVSSSYFSATFSDPPTTVVTSPSSGGGGGSSSRTETVVEYYSMKIIVPEDITILPDNSVELDFTLQNNGNVDLLGINLSSAIKLGGQFSDEISIDFLDSYVEALAVGEKKDYRMRVGINSQAVGDYTITIFGNVTSPAFSDWGDFHVRVQELDKSQLSQLLIFTEKLVSENPECLELREVYNEARLQFEAGNLAEANRLANDVVRACEDAISANEQISFLDDRFTKSVFYSAVVSIVLLFGWLMYYFYRRVKFKKFANKEYI